MASGRWFVNDAINVLHPDNWERVRVELVPPNVVFGLHRWYAGGSSPHRVALGDPQAWDAELGRSRPGDNLILVSLRRVRHRAIAHAGAVDSVSPPIVSPAVEEQLLQLLRDPAGELAVVHRYARTDGAFACAYDIVWDPSPDEWLEHLERWSSLRGELLFFDDAEILWQDQGGREGVPPESWASQYGDYLFKGYFPDKQGRVVTGGAH